MSDKLHQLEAAINKISKVSLAKPDSAPTHARERVLLAKPVKYCYF